MSLILDGTNGLSDVDGTAATPAIRGTDTNTGIFFPAADTIAFAEGGTEVARFDSAGNLGIGTTSPTSKVDVSGEIKTLNGTAALGVIIKRTDGVNANGAVNFVGSDDAVDASVRMATDVANALVFTAGGATERMRIDSAGNVGININPAGDGRFVVQAAGSSQPMIRLYDSNGGTASQQQVNFRRAGVDTGGIYCTNAATSYTSASDYRLKENIVPMTGALDKVQALKPVTYDWKTGGSSQGFIAHELQAIVPDCVTGEKDAVNEDGSIKPQGIDTSFLVATLTAAIQELKAMITSLTARIAALENPPVESVTNE